MTTEPDFIVETFIVRRVRSKTQFQPYHATYLTSRGLKLRSKSFVEQRLIDR